MPSVPRSVAEPERTNDVNVTGTLAVLEASRKAGVRRVVFASSSSAYGDTPVLPKVETMPPCPLSPYALQKYAGERYCQLFHRLYGFETVALRYFNVYGPAPEPEERVRGGDPPLRHGLPGRRARRMVFGDGEQTRDFTFVGDAVAANLLAADAQRAPGEVMNVAGGRRVSLNELLREICSLTGARFQPRYQPARPGDVRDSLADLSRARELLGYDPQVDLRTGLARTIQHLESAKES